MLFLHLPSQGRKQVKKMHQINGKPTFAPDENMAPVTHNNEESDNNHDDDYNYYKHQILEE